NLSPVRHPGRCYRGPGFGGEVGACTDRGADAGPRRAEGTAEAAGGDTGGEDESPGRPEGCTSLPQDVRGGCADIDRASFRERSSPASLTVFVTRAILNLLIARIFRTA